MLDTFIKFTNKIDGECTDEKHKKWIECLGFSHGIAQHASGSFSGGGSRVGGKVDMQDFSFTKRMDSSSPNLNKACCEGTHIDKVNVELCKNTGKKEVMVKYEFEKVLVTSVQASGGGDGVPIESVTFTFGKISWEYVPVDEKGKPGTAVKANHDLTTNKTA